MNLNNIPTDPGCYLFFNKKNEIIYIGKAKDLKKRVRNYFQKKDHDTKTKHLVNNIDKAEYFITSNEREALILENTLIKKHNPKYYIMVSQAAIYKNHLNKIKILHFHLVLNNNIMQVETHWQ